MTKDSFIGHLRPIVQLGLLAFLILWPLGAVAQPPAVAVFNFQMKSETPEWVWLEKGLADRIATDFFRQAGMTVTARDEMQHLASSMNWVPEMAVQPDQADKISTQLRTTHVISGVYSIETDRITITAQIVNLETRKELARKTVQGKADDVLELQRQLSAQLLEWFTKQPAADILTQLPIWTRSLPAVKAIYQGMHLYDQGRYTEAWLEFRQAAKVDAGYMEAQYWVAKMYYFMDRYKHAAKAMEEFIYLNPRHPRMEDAVKEFLNIYEKCDVAPQQLLDLYQLIGQRYPKVMTKLRTYRGDYLTMSQAMDQKIARQLYRMGRYKECLLLMGPPIGGQQFMPRHEAFWSALAHQRVTGETFSLKELVETPEHFINSGEVLPFPAGGEAISLLNGTDTPYRIRGSDYRNLDPDSLLEGTCAGKTFIAFAPSGFIFKTLRFYPIVDGDDGILDISVSPIDSFISSAKSDVAAARKDGLLIDSFLPSGYVSIGWGVGVKDQKKSPPLIVRRMRIVAQLEKMGSRGQIDVSCRQTTEFTVWVDGKCGRSGPGVVGFLPPGEHVVELRPRLEKSPFDSTTVRVTVQAGKTAEVAADLPWKKGSPWSSWVVSSLGQTPFGEQVPEYMDDRYFKGVTVQADETAIRLVWGWGDDLYSSYSTDGQTYSTPRRIPLPVSSAWMEKTPYLFKDESGRHVLTFLSDRDEQHREMAYVCWSRDFSRWSEPVMIEQRSIQKEVDGIMRTVDSSHGQRIVQDSRGRYLLVQWDTSHGTVWISQSRDLVAWDLVTKFRYPIKGGYLLHGAWLEFPSNGRYQLAAYTNTFGTARIQSDDLLTWSEPVFGPAATRPPIPDDDLSVEMYTWHRRWGHVLVRMFYSSDRRLPHNGDGPFVWHGQTIPPVAPPAETAPLVKAKPSKSQEETRTFDWQGNVANRGPVPIAPLAADYPVGQLTYVRQERQDALFPSDLRVGMSTFVPAPPGCGTVNRFATVATLSTSDGKVYKIAMDSDDPDRPVPDLARVDLSGKGDFRKAAVLRPGLSGGPVAHMAMLSKDGKSRKVYQGGIYWGTVRRQIAGKEVLSEIWLLLGEYQDKATISMTVSTGLDGICRFGDKTHRVRFIDCTSNLIFTDKPKPYELEGKIVNAEGGDTVWVDLGDGLFNNAHRAFMGDPVLVDGRLWTLEISGDNTQVTATPYRGPVGMLHINHPCWSIRLVGKAHTICLTGNERPVPVPVDEGYKVVQYREASSATRKHPWMGFELEPWLIKQPLMAIKEGKTIALAIGTPLNLNGQLSRLRDGTAKVSFDKQKALQKTGPVMVNVQVTVTDVIGSPRKGNFTMVSDDASCPGPVFELRDASGKALRKINSTFSHWTLCIDPFPASEGKYIIVKVQDGIVPVLFDPLTYEYKPAKEEASSEAAGN